MSGLFHARFPDNQGQVKLNSHSVGLIKPTIVGFSSDEAQFFLYNGSPLNLSSEPTNQWPKSPILIPADNDIVDSTTFKVKENPIPGQGHLWRISVMFSNKAIGNNMGLSMGLYNPISGFTTSDVKTLPAGTTDTPNVDFSIPLGQAPGTTVQPINMTYLLYTIGDSASIGLGYFIFATSTQGDNNLTVTISSITRISLQD